MAKPVSIRVPSDDCQVVVNGQACFPHEGEWVEVLGGLTAGDLLAVMAMEDLGDALAQAKGDPDETRKVKTATREHFERVMTALASGVTAWNWTDLRGRPIVPWNATDEDGRPYAVLDGTNIGAFRDLRVEEQAWLTRVLQGGTPTQEKKDGKRSPTTSSATRPAPNRKR